MTALAANNSNNNNKRSDEIHNLNNITNTNNSNINNSNGNINNSGSNLNSNNTNRLVIRSLTNNTNTNSVNTSNINKTINSKEPPATTTTTTTSNECILIENTNRTLLTANSLSCDLDSLSPKSPSFTTLTQQQQTLNFKFRQGIVDLEKSYTTPPQSPPQQQQPAPLGSLSFRLSISRIDCAPVAATKNKLRRSITLPVLLNQLKVEKALQINETQSETKTELKSESKYNEKNNDKNEFNLSCSNRLIKSKSLPTLMIAAADHDESNDQVNQQEQEKQKVDTNKKIIKTQEEADKETDTKPETEIHIETKTNTKTEAKTEAETETETESVDVNKDGDDDDAVRVSVECDQISNKSASNVDINSNLIKSNETEQRRRRKDESNPLLESSSSSTSKSTSTSSSSSTSCASNSNENVAQQQQQQQTENSFNKIECGVESCSLLNEPPTAETSSTELKSGNEIRLENESTESNVVDANKLMMETNDHDDNDRNQNDEDDDHQLAHINLNQLESNQPPNPNNLTSNLMPTNIKIEQDYNESVVVGVCQMIDETRISNPSSTDTISTITTATTTTTTNTAANHHQHQDINLSLENFKQFKSQLFDNQLKLRDNLKLSYQRLRNIQTKYFHTHVAQQLNKILELKETKHRNQQSINNNNNESVMAPSVVVPPLVITPLINQQPTSIIDDTSVDILTSILQSNLGQSESSTKLNTKTTTTTTNRNEHKRETTTNDETNDNNENVNLAVKSLLDDIKYEILKQTDDKSNERSNYLKDLRRSSIKAPPLPPKESSASLVVANDKDYDESNTNREKDDEYNDENVDDGSTTVSFNDEPDNDDLTEDDDSDDESILPKKSKLTSAAAAPIDIQIQHVNNNNLNQMANDSSKQSSDLANPIDTTSSQIDQTKLDENLKTVKSLNDETPTASAPSAAAAKVSAATSAAETATSTSSLVEQIASTGEVKKLIDSSNWFWTMSRVQLGSEWERVQTKLKYIRFKEKHCNDYLEKRQRLLERFNFTNNSTHSNKAASATQASVPAPSAATVTSVIKQDAITEITEPSLTSAANINADLPDNQTNVMNEMNDGTGNNNNNDDNGQTTSVDSKLICSDEAAIAALSTSLQQSVAACTTNNKTLLNEENNIASDKQVAETLAESDVVVAAAVVAADVALSCDDDKSTSKNDLTIGIDTITTSSGSTTSGIIPSASVAVAPELVSPIKTTTCEDTTQEDATQTAIRCIPYKIYKSKSRLFNLNRADLIQLDDDSIRSLYFTLKYFRNSYFRTLCECGETSNDESVSASSIASSATAATAAAPASTTKVASTKSEINKKRKLTNKKPTKQQKMSDLLSKKKTCIFCHLFKEYDKNRIEQEEQEINSKIKQQQQQQGQQDEGQDQDQQQINNKSFKNSYASLEVVRQDHSYCKQISPQPPPPLGTSLASSQSMLSRTRTLTKALKSKRHIVDSTTTTVMASGQTMENQNQIENMTNIDENDLLDLLTNERLNKLFNSSSNKSNRNLSTTTATTTTNSHKNRKSLFNDEDYDELNELNQDKIIDLVKDEDDENIIDAGFDMTPADQQNLPDLSYEELKYLHEIEFEENNCATGTGGVSGGVSSAPIIMMMRQRNEESSDEIEIDNLNEEFTNQSRTTGNTTTTTNTTNIRSHRMFLSNSLNADSLYSSSTSYKPRYRTLFASNINSKRCRLEIYDELDENESELTNRRHIVERGTQSSVATRDQLKYNRNESRQIISKTGRRKLIRISKESSSSSSTSSVSSQSNLQLEDSSVERQRRTRQTRRVRRDSTCSTVSRSNSTSSRTADDKHSICTSNSLIVNRNVKRTRTKNSNNSPIPPQTTTTTTTASQRNSIIPVSIKRKRNRSTSSYSSTSSIQSSYDLNGGGCGLDNSSTNGITTTTTTNNKSNGGSNGNNYGYYNYYQSHKFDIDNIVIPYDMASNSLKSLNVNKNIKIPTPKWRELILESLSKEQYENMIKEARAARNDGSIVEVVNEEEDLNDAAYINRHKVIELREHDLTLNKKKYNRGKKGQKYKTKQQQQQQQQQQQINGGELDIKPFSSPHSLVVASQISITDASSNQSLVIDTAETNNNNKNSKLFLNDDDLLKTNNSKEILSISLPSNVFSKCLNKNVETTTTTTINSNAKKSPLFLLNETDEETNANLVVASAPVAASSSSSSNEFFKFKTTLNSGQLSNSLSQSTLTAANKQQTIQTLSNNTSSKTTINKECWPTRTFPLNDADLDLIKKQDEMATFQTKSYLCLTTNNRRPSVTNDESNDI